MFYSSLAPGSTDVAHPNDGQHDADTALSKTRMCVYYLQGRCKYGDACTYAHFYDELKKAPANLRKTKLCDLFLVGHCTDADCNFAHSSDELRHRGNVTCSMPGSSNPQVSASSSKENLLSYAGAQRTAMGSPTPATSTGSTPSPPPPAAPLAPRSDSGKWNPAVDTDGGSPSMRAPCVDRDLSSVYGVDGPPTERAARVMLGVLLRLPLRNAVSLLQTEDCRQLLSLLALDSNGNPINVASEAVSSSAAASKHAKQQQAFAHRPQSVPLPTIADSSCGHSHAGFDSTRYGLDSLANGSTGANSPLFQYECADEAAPVDDEGFVNLQKLVVDSVLTDDA